MQKLIVKKERVGPIRGRHPWVFSGALERIPEGLKGGAPVELVDAAGQFLASGYFNSYSQIAVRLWSWQAGEVVDDDFFARRVTAAYNLRLQYVASQETNSYRLINAENDLLPGLIVDKYANYLVAQFHTLGMEAWQESVVNALIKIINPKGIYKRSDAGRAKREPSVVILNETKNPLKQALRDSSVAATLPQNDSLGGELLFGNVPDRIKIKENGHKFWVDVINGQKTGFFLDQRDKRLALQKYVKNKKVLNCFSYTGGFSIYALAAGANQVVNVDSSEPALTLAEENVKLNKLDESKCEFISADVKEYLFDRTKGEFDVIILDPPAFIKDRHKIKEGIMGYKNINQLALKILPPNGILVTCSCSAHLTLTDFRFMLTEAAARAQRTVQILESFFHGLDHPMLTAYTEGEYLKCLVVRVL